MPTLFIQVIRVKNWKYLELVGRIEGDFANVWVLAAIFQYVPIHRFDAFQYGNLGSITIGIPVSNNQSVTLLYSQPSLGALISTKSSLDRPNSNSEYPGTVRT